MSKSFFKFAIRFLLKSNIYTALGASCVAYITFFLLNIPSSPVVLAAIFFEFFLAYNFNRLTDFDEDAINAPERKSFVNKYTKPLIAAGTIAYIYLLFQVLLANFYAFLFIVMQTLFGLAYSKYRIKKYYFIKNIYIAIAWGMIVLFAGVYNNALAMPIILFSIIIAATFFINSMISDIKDMAGDKAVNINTIPGIIGSRNTVLIGYAVNTASFFLLGGGIILGIFSEKAMILFLLVIYVYTYLYMEGKLSKDTYYGLLVDGEFIFTAGMICLYGVFYG